MSGSDYFTEKNLKVVEKIKALTEKYNCSVTQAVTGYFYHQPFSCVPLYGTSSPAHVADVCGALDVPFTDDDYKDIWDVSI